MSKSAMVSVVIDNYNYGRFVARCLDSVLAQTYPHVEVIIVDDGSADESRDIISSYGNRVVPVFQPNGGQASALNAGFRVARGEWIFLLDSDDFFEPHKISFIMQLVAEFPSAGLIAHDLSYCNEQGDPITFAPPYILARVLVDDRKLAKRGSLSVSLPAHSGLCFRRDVFEALFPLPEDIRMGIDNYMKWVALSRYPVLLTPELLTVQRIHGSNAGTTIQESGSHESRLKLAMQSARTSYHVNRNHSHLKKLTWKQYGRTLYGLRSTKAKEAKGLENKIRSQYSVVERTPVCYLYVAAAYVKAYLEDLRRARQHAN